MKKAIFLISVALLTSCAPRSSNIAASPVSPTRYEDWSCDKIKKEKIFVENALSRVSSDQDNAADNDAMMVFLIGVPTSNGGVRGEVARFKGELEALERISIEKDCGLSFERPTPAPKKPNNQYNRKKGS